LFFHWVHWGMTHSTACLKLMLLPHPWPCKDLSWLDPVPEVCAHLWPLYYTSSSFSQLSSPLCAFGFGCRLVQLSHLEDGANEKDCSSETSLIGLVQARECPSNKALNRRLRISCWVRRGVVVGLSPVHPVQGLEFREWQAFRSVGLGDPGCGHGLVEWSCLDSGWKYSPW
jgi:hypothetical protein